MITPSPYQIVLMQDMGSGAPVSLTFAPSNVRSLLKRLIFMGHCEVVTQTFEGDSAVYEFCTLTLKGKTYLEALALLIHDAPGSASRVWLAGILRAADTLGAQS